MQNNRQRWKQETNKAMSGDEFKKQLKRMRCKRQKLTDRENATALDWDYLAQEYEDLGFMSNAASCRTRAKQMRKSEREPIDWTV